MVQEERRQWGWEAEELGGRRKSDPGKLALAARLCRETTLSLKAIAAQVQLGTSRRAHARLHAWRSANAVPESASAKKAVGT